MTPFFLAFDLYTDAGSYVLEKKKDSHSISKVLTVIKWNDNFNVYLS